MEVVFRRSILRRLAWTSVLFLAAPTLAAAEPIVPGTGERVAGIGDDFEDGAWEYIPAFPKSSSNIDHNRRLPAGRSRNNKWFESTYRGAPDVIKRVPTPPGGLEGSEGAMMIRTMRSGIPDSPDGTMQQDDLIGNVSSTIGGAAPPSWGPSVVCHVYLPPWEQWEKRSGSSFGFRLDLRGQKPGEDEIEEYWPGMFIQFNYNSPRKQPDSALLILRGGPRGQDFNGPIIKEPGWWTLGMSVSADGMIHYYAHAGLEPLTSTDRISSQYPYGYRCVRYHNYFFDVMNLDGRTWSTAWVIDDVSGYFLHRGRAGSPSAAASRPQPSKPTQQKIKIR
jgi:hypothetical protein